MLLKSLCYSNSVQKITKPQLQIASAVCSNFVVAWLGAMLLTRDPVALTMNFVAAIVSWKAAIRAEEILEDYYD